MATPYLGQLSIVGFGFAPKGGAIAAGQLMPLSQNTALFSLLGTYYGGNGTSTFALPNLQAAVALGVGTSPGLNQYFLGETGGVSSVTLQTSETPNHTHQPMGTATVRNKQSTPVGNSFSDSSGGNIYSAATLPLNPASGNAVSLFGNGQAHNNLMPY